MTIRITKDFTFLSSLHFQDKFMVNLYEMNASMIIETFDQIEQNIAIERINYFLTDMLEGCIFIQDTEHEAMEKYSNAGLKIVSVPEEPYDQIIGLLLINKCNAIMENKIHLSDIIFGSKLSNLIKFDLSSEMAINEYPEKNWYNDSSLATHSKKKKEKIVKLFDGKNDWADLELTWPKK